MKFVVYRELEVKTLSQHPVIQELFDRPIERKLWVAPMAGGLDYVTIYNNIQFNEYK